MSQNQFAVSVTIKAVDQATKTINQVAQNIKTHADRINAIQRISQEKLGLNKLSSSIDQIKSSTDGLFSTTGVTSFYHGIQNGSQHAVTALRGISTAAKDVLTLLTGAGLVMGGLGVASSRLFSDVSQSSTDLRLSAAKLNVPRSLLQSYRSASESIGVPSGKVDSALERLSQIGFEYRRGNRAAAEPLMALPGGFNIVGKDNQQLPPQEMLSQVADKLNTKGISEVTKVQLAGLIFGDADILPFLKLGSAGISSRAASFKRDEDYNRSDLATAQYLSATTRLKESLEGLKLMLSIEVFPGVSEGLNQISNWLGQHKAEVRQFFSDLGKSIPKEMKAALEWVSVFAKGLSFLSQHVGIANVAFTLFSAKIGLALGKGILSAGLSVWSFSSGAAGLIQNLILPMLSLNSIMSAFITLLQLPVIIVGALTSTVGLVVAAIAAIGVASFFLIRNWDKVKTWFVSFKTTVIEIFSDVVSFVTESLKRVVASVLNALGLKSSPKSGIFTPLNLQKGAVSDGSITPFLKNRSEASTFLEQLFRVNPNTLHPNKESTTPNKSAEVTLRIENLPIGSRVTDQKGDFPLNLDLGFSLAGSST